MKTKTIRQSGVTAFLTVLVAAAMAPTTAVSQPNDHQAANSRRPAWKFAVTDDSRAAGSAAVKKKRRLGRCARHNRQRHG